MVEQGLCAPGGGLLGRRRRGARPVRMQGPQLCALRLPVLDLGQGLGREPRAQRLLLRGRQPAVGQRVQIVVVEGGGGAVVHGGAGFT